MYSDEVRDKGERAVRPPVVCDATTWGRPGEPVKCEREVGHSGFHRGTDSRGVICGWSRR